MLYSVVLASTAQQNESAIHIQGIYFFIFIFIFHGRKNSVRDKVMGKKWIYLERNTLPRQSVGHLRRGERPRAFIFKSLF